MDNNQAPANFKPSNWLARINLISHLVLFNNVLMAVIAEEKGGKSSFVNVLCTELDPNIKTHVIKAEFSFEEVTFVDKLKELLIDCPSSLMTISDIVSYVNEQKNHILFVVDDAHNVAYALLKKILNELKNYSDTNYFHVCLVSDFTLAPVLRELNIDIFKNHIHAMKLGDLNAKETKAYLLKNLPLPKYYDKTKVDKRFEQLYHLTSGNIARLNNYITNFFHIDTLVSVKTKPWLAMASVFIISFFTVFYFWQYKDLVTLTKHSVLALNEEPALTKEIKHTAESQLKQPLALALQQETTPKILAQNDKLVSAAGLDLAESTDKIKEKKLIDDTSVDKVKNTDEVVAKQTVAAKGTTKIVEEYEQLINDDNHETFNDLSLSLTDGDDTLSNFKNDETYAASDKGDDNNEMAKNIVSILESDRPTKVKASDDDNVSTDLDTDDALKDNSAELITKLEEKSYSENKPNPIINEPVKTAAEAKTAKNQERFTIQLIASTKRYELLKFISEHQLNNLMTIRSTRHLNGKEWLVVTLGDYNRKEQAKMAMLNLPSELTRLRPWVRPVNDFGKSIA